RVHDHATATVRICLVLCHGGRSQSKHVERTVEEEIDIPLELFEGCGFAIASDNPGCACAAAMGIDDDSERCQFLCHGDRCVDAGFVEYVGIDVTNLVSEFYFQCLAAFVVEIGDDNCGSGAYQLANGGFAETARTSG